MPHKKMFQVYLTTNFTARNFYLLPKIYSFFYLSRAEKNRVCSIIYDWTVIRYGNGSATMVQVHSLPKYRCTMHTLLFNFPFIYWFVFTITVSWDREPWTLFAHRYVDYKSYFIYFNVILRKEYFTQNCFASRSF